MNTQCKFQSCSWSGNVTSLFKHCDSEHSNFVIDIRDDNHFELNYEDVGSNTFLLCGKEGLYWFLMDRKLHQDRIRRGIFAIDDSEICEYTILVGRKDAHTFVASDAPHQTLPIKSKKFEIEWTMEKLKFFQQMSVNCMWIIFSEPQSLPEIKSQYQGKPMSDDDEEGSESDSEDDDSDEDEDED